MTNHTLFPEGRETLKYTSEHFTGKFYNPFYFGSDNVHKKIAVFEFDKNGVLEEFSVSEEKSIF